MTQQIEINPKHNVQSLYQTLKKERRLQVADFFTEESAELLHRLLLENKNWYLSYNQGENNYESSMAQVQALEPKQRQTFMNNIYSRASSKFQYVFNQYYITKEIELNEDPGNPLHQFQDFMNSDSTLDFMRALTGEPLITKADSYATQYLPGHFLTDHDDRHDKHDRVAAYVFSMTKNWNKNWGGQLVFFDEDGNIEQGFVPSFNTLNIFLIPQSHSVQLVAPYAAKSRISYLGWFHR